MFFKVLVIGEVVIKGPLGHHKSAGQGLDRESFGSCLFKQGEPFLEPAASGEKRHDLFPPLLDTFLFLISYHMVWYVCKRRMLFSSLCWLRGTSVVEKGALRAIYWSHSACRREVAKIESESVHVFHTLVDFVLSSQRSSLCSLFSSLSGTE